MSNAYTESETKKLIDAYAKNPSLENVSRLSVKFNRTKKSIISKLVKEGVYEKQGYRTKLGEKPESKLLITRDIEDMLDAQLVDLDKCPKSTLKALRSNIEGINKLVRINTSEIKELKELIKTQSEMLQGKNLNYEGTFICDTINDVEKLLGG